MARRDAVAAAVMLLVAAAAATESARLLPYGAVRNPGPGFFPLWMSCSLAFLSLVLLGHALVTQPAPPTADAAGRWGKVVGVLAILGAYALVLEPVGYPVATFLLVLFMLRVTEPHRWPVAVGVSLLAAGGSYVLFAVWLKVPLPPGILAR